MRAVTHILRAADRIVTAEIVTLLLAQSKLSAQLREAQEWYDSGGGLDETPDEDRPLAPEAFDYLEGAQARRMQSVETKASASLIGISLAVPILTTVGALVGNAAPQVTTLVEPSGTTGEAVSIASPGMGIPSVLVLLAAGYLLIGGMFALLAMRVGRRYELNLRDFTSSDSERLAIRTFLLRQNDLLLLQRVNLLTVSQNAVINGLVIMIAGAIVDRFA